MGEPFPGRLRRQFRDEPKEEVVVGADRRRRDLHPGQGKERLLQPRQDLGHIATQVRLRGEPPALLPPVVGEDAEMEPSLPPAGDATAKGGEPVGPKAMGMAIPPKHPRSPSSPGGRERSLPLRALIALLKVRSQPKEKGRIPTLADEDQKTDGLNQEELPPSPPEEPLPDEALFLQPSLPPPSHPRSSQGEQVPEGNLPSPPTAGSEENLLPNPLRQKVQRPMLNSFFSIKARRPEAQGAGKGGKRGGIGLAPPRRDLLLPLGPLSQGGSHILPTEEGDRGGGNPSPHEEEGNIRLFRRSPAETPIGKASLRLREVSHRPKGSLPIHGSQKAKAGVSLQGARQPIGSPRRGKTGEDLLCPTTLLLRGEGQPKGSGANLLHLHLDAMGSQGLQNSLGRFLQPSLPKGRHLDTTKGGSEEEDRAFPQAGRL